MKEREYHNDVAGFFSALGGEPEITSVAMGGTEASLRKARVGDAIYLMKIRTDEQRRGNGDASALLDHICSTADAFGVELFLEVEQQDDSELDADELAEWYFRYGFRGDPTEMIRKPATTH